MMDDNSNPTDKNDPDNADFPGRSERQGGEETFSGEEKQLVLLLLLAGLVIRLIYVTLVRHDPLFYSTFLDAANYRSWAESITNGSLWSGVHDVMPFYAYLNAGMLALFGDTLVPLYVFQTLAGLLTAWIVFLLGRNLFPEPTGLLAMALFLVHPDWIVLETRPVPTVWTGLFVAAGVLFLIYASRSDQPLGRWVFASSFVFTLAVVTEAGVLFVIPVVLVWMVIRRDWAWSTGVSASMAWVLPILVVMGGVLWLNDQALHKAHDSGGLLLQTGTGRAFYGGSGPDARGIPPAHPGFRNDRMDRMVDNKNMRDPIERDRMFLAETTRHLRAHPGEVFYTALRKVYYFLTNYSVETTEPVAALKKQSVMFSLPLLSFGFFMVLGGIGLCRGFWIGGNYLCIPLVVLGLFAGPFLVGVSVRGRTTAMPLLAVLTGQGVLYVAYALQRLDLRVLSWVLPVMLALMTGFVPMMNVETDRNTAYMTPYWRAKALWKQGRQNDALDALNSSPSGLEIPQDHRIYLNYQYAKYLFVLHQQDQQGERKLVNPLFPARTVLDQMKNRNITFPKAHTLMGRIKMNNGQYAEAVDHLRASLKQHQQRDTWLMLGEALLRNEAYSNALEEMDQALEQFPECDRCRMIRARAQGLQGNWDRAIDTLTKILEKHSDGRRRAVQAEASYYTGYLYERTGRPDQARTFYRQSIEAGGEYGQKSSERMKQLQEQMKNQEKNTSGGDD